MPRRLFRLFSALLFALALVATACGNDDDGPAAQVIEESAPEATSTQAAPSPTEAAAPEPAPTEAPPAPAPTQTALAPTEAAAPEPAPTEAPPDRPQRIVSLSPTATEILFAIGAGEQVVAVDEFSYYPPEAPVTDLSGWNPNVEAVLSYEPDLVVIANDANDLMAGLDAVGVEVLLSLAPADFEGGYASIAELGVAVGRIDEAAVLVADLRAEIDAALADAPDVPIRVYHELDNTYFSVSSNSFIGAVYAAMGAINIADEADADGYGYPQLTEEYIVEADPELIVITDLVGYTPEDVAARPGWGDVTAARNGNIVVVNSDIASRWGPRLPQFIAAVAEALQTVTASAS
ncbi:ABC transporter substrate-binding protein [Candidatus Poriferisocius sp.]|uniref:ABC transporter substrate-binding protein n=1 Tax=Candidatus Poriferisocius sp. TaxID=3101276 RepID=UPI003B019036